MQCLRWFFTYKYSGVKRNGVITNFCRGRETRPLQLFESTNPELRIVNCELRIMHNSNPIEDRFFFPHMVVNEHLIIKPFVSVFVCVVKMFFYGVLFGITSFC